jgi:hypothetical protein
MFAKQDEQFDEMAIDPARRREGIADLSSRRTIILWCAVGMTSLALVFFFANRAAGGAAAVGFAAAVQWMLAFKFESELRLLRVVERLHRDRDNMTTC